MAHSLITETAGEMATDFMSEITEFMVINELARSLPDDDRRTSSLDESCLVMLTDTERLEVNGFTRYQGFVSVTLGDFIIKVVKL